MAVIVYQKLKIGNETVDVQTYEPAGPLSKQERVRAEKLDEVLRTRVPLIAEELTAAQARDDGAISQWYRLGCKLREIVEDPNLVTRTDIAERYLWLAIWHYMPDSIRPSRSKDNRPYAGKHHKHKDHLSLCYEISKFPWSKVAWLKRWDDWQQLMFRPGLIKDERIFTALAKAISEMDRYPSRKAYRAIVKGLGEEFPTRRLKDSSVICDAEISEIVVKIVENVAENE